MKDRTQSMGVNEVERERERERERWDTDGGCERGREKVRESER